MVLMGGWSAEREVSLLSGNGVLGALTAGGYPATGYDLAPAENRTEAVAELLKSIRESRIDIVYIALHGPFGEDGTLQGLLDMAGVPYTGSGVLSSALAMDKVASKLVFVASRVATPKFEVVARGSIPPRSPLPLPVFVKPRAQGSSVGVSLVEKDGEYGPALEKAHAFGDAVVETAITGRELEAPVLDNEALPLIEIIPKNRFYDYEAKYTPGMSEHRTPAPVPAKQYQAAQRLAVAAHRALGCEGVTRVEMIAESTGTLYLLEVNTIPGMTPTSLVPESAREAGMSYLDLVVRQLESGFRRGKVPA
jgi:D-alanine-D-alanine ligase